MKSKYFPVIVWLLVSTYCGHTTVKRATWSTANVTLPVHLYTLEDDWLRIQLTDYGARIVSLEAPDRNGLRSNVVLGFNNAAQYVADPKAYYGATIGRFANRLAKGTFVVAGHVEHVPINNNGNALHGGPNGFSTKIWKGKSIGQTAVEFALDSPNGDMGFPGDLKVRVRYTLIGKSLRIDYIATTNKATVLNLTNHTYFNLQGEDSGNILNERLRLEADRYTPIDSSLIPTGEIVSVAGTPFDFRKLTAIGERIGEDNDQLRKAGGYDHNFVLAGRPGRIRKAAFVFDPASGRTLRVFTTEPAVQFYSGNFLNGTVRGYAGKLYQKYAGFCLETQHFPDSPNHSDFPSTMLRSGEIYSSTTLLVFGTENSNFSGD